MMWQPIWSAWKMLSNSRGLAQISSWLGYGFIISTAADISGTGSRPVSAINPANPDNQLGIKSAKAAETSRTCESVKSAVTLILTLARAKRFISAQQDSD